MKRRAFLLSGTVGLSAAAQAALSGAGDDGESIQRLAMAWRGSVGPDATGGAAQDFVGVLQVDWERREVRVAAAVPVPDRAHGLLAESDGGFVAVATRPGRWLLRCDAAGRLVRRHSLDDETPRRSLDGHVVASADGLCLYTPETDSRSGEGWVSVRDRQTLAKLAEWRSHGRDPHQCVLDAQGALIVANGGIPRTADGKKRDLEQMNPSLVRLDGRSGELLGQWRLDDPRQSIRHLAWSRPPAGGAPQAPLLGIGLQAEHDDVDRRRAAPALAVWDGRSLRIPSHDALAGGYAGDIAPGPGGGFVLSGQRAGRAVLWHPDAPAELFKIAELTEVCALSAWTPASGAPGVVLGAQRGVARWHPARPPAMLAWPGPMAPDNHWVMLAAGA